MKRLAEKFEQREFQAVMGGGEAQFRNVWARIFNMTKALNHLFCKFASIS